MTIHQGMMLGRLQANSSPVISAEPLPKRVSRLNRKRSMHHSVSKQAAQLSNITHKAFQPNTQSDTAKVGISATTTVHMQRLTLLPLWICGDRDIVNCEFIYSDIYLSFLISCFPNLIKSSNGLLDGQT
jgi:hypothetical protein